MRRKRNSRIQARQCAHCGKTRRLNDLPNPHTFTHQWQHIECLRDEFYQLQFIPATNPLYDNLQAQFYACSSSDLAQAGITIGQLGVEDYDTYIDSYINQYREDAS
jgi:hypothetical protein